MMWWIEALGREVPEASGVTTAVSRPEGVAVVLDEIQIMSLHEVKHTVEIVRIAQRMSEHDGAGPGTDGIGQAVHDDVRRPLIDIHKHRHASILNDGRNGGGKACRDRNHFIAWHERTFKLLTGERCK